MEGVGRVQGGGRPLSSRAPSFRSLSSSLPLPLSRVHKVPVHRPLDRPPGAHQAVLLRMNQHRVGLLVHAREVGPVGVLPVGLDPANVLHAAEAPLLQAVPAGFQALGAAAPARARKMGSMCVIVCVCMCLREREIGRGGVRERIRESGEGEGTGRRKRGAPTRGRQSSASPRWPRCRGPGSASSSTTRGP